LKRAFICDAFKDARLAHDQLENTVDNLANARATLRTMVAYGSSSRPSLPGSDGLIWSGDLRWCHPDGRDPSCEEFNWLIDYLVNPRFGGLGDEAKGDALLALSAMHGLGSSDKQSSYVGALVYSMASNRCSRVRHAALRAVSDARDELASLTDHSIAQGAEAGLLDRLSAALLTAVRPNNNDTTPSRSSPSLSARNRCYLRLIFSLSKNDEWCTRLTRDGHVLWCNSLHDEVLASPYFLDKFQLSTILLRLDLSPEAAQETRWTLIKRAWSKLCPLDEDNIGALPLFVTTTRRYLPDRIDYASRRTELDGFMGDVRGVLEELRHVPRGGAALAQAYARLDTAQIVQEFYLELLRRAELHS
jgi:hypothetical protein